MYMSDIIHNTPHVSGHLTRLFSIPLLNVSLPGSQTGSLSTDIGRGYEKSRRWSFLMCWFVHIDNKIAHLIKIQTRPVHSVSSVRLSLSLQSQWSIFSRFWLLNDRGLRVAIIKSLRLFWFLRHSSIFSNGYLWIVI